MVTRAKTAGSFKKGDSRINRKGRPRTFDALRKLAQQIGHEDAVGEDGAPVLADDAPVTTTENILRQWVASKNPVLQIKFMEVAYGKVPDPIELTGKNGGAVTVRIVHEDDEQ